MGLEEKLSEIWDKYRPQRDAESNAAEVQRQAAAELQELNKRRVASGLSMVGEPSPFGQAGIQGIMPSGYYGIQSPKTWRGHMDEEILAAVREWFRAKEAE